MTEKVSRDDYFTAAFELLAIGGKSALTTTAVCRRIGVTTGSLYHHFGSGAAFYRAVIDYWENDVTVAQRRRVDAVADPRERLATLEQGSNRLPAKPITRSRRQSAPGPWPTGMSPRRSSASTRCAMSTSPSTTSRRDSPQHGRILWRASVSASWSVPSNSVRAWITNGSTPRSTSIRPGSIRRCRRR